MNPRLEILLQSRDLAEHAAEDDEVVWMWEKAVMGIRNSTRGLDPPIEFAVAYTAAFQAATAVLFACGYRASGRDHHHNTFAAVKALGTGDLARSADELDALRLDRHESVYGTESTISDERLSQLRSAARQLLSSGLQRIRSERPALEERLTPAV